jgi:peptide/nickel transport system substrate-binding protein
MWRRVGIDVRIENEPARVFFAETMSKRRFTGMGMFAWISSPESVPRTTLHSEEIPTEANGWAGQNYTSFENAGMDELLDTIEITLDRAEREQLWHELQRLYATELPAIPLYFRSDAHVWPHWLEGVEPAGHQAATSLGVEHWRVAEGG